MDLPRRGWLMAMAVAGSVPGALAGTNAIESELPGARLRGRGRLTFLGLPVYDIGLWSAEPLTAGVDWSSRPLALEIIYARRLEGRRIAERSLAEMRRQAPISDAEAQRWLAAMLGVFPDVQAKDRICGIHLPAREARFLVNDRPAGSVADARFARLFFGIWLSAQTSEPGLRDSLLGVASS